MTYLLPSLYVLAGLLVGWVVRSSSADRDELDLRNTMTVNRDAREELLARLNQEREKSERLGALVQDAHDRGVL